MKRFILILVIFAAFTGCGERVNENDTDQLNGMMKDIAQAITTGENVPHDTEYSLRIVRQRIGEPTLEKVITPPILKRINPSVHVDSLQVNALYKIDGNLFNTKWHFGRDEESGEWKLFGPTVRDLDSSDLIYNTEDVLIAGLDYMDWDSFNALEPATGWGSSNDLLILLKETFTALIDKKMDSLMFLTSSGTLLRADANDTDITYLISDYLPNREFDPDGTRKYLEEQIEHTDYIMEYCQAETKEVLPYIQAYSIDSMPEYCIKVSLSMTFTRLDKLRGITVGERSMMGFTVEWAAARVNEKWFMESLLINCLVTDMAKGLYRP